LAIENYENALEIQRELGDRRGEANTLANLAGVHKSTGSSRLAIENYEKALAIQKELQDRRGESYTLSNLAEAYATEGNNYSIELYENALVLKHEVGDIRGEGITLWKMSIALDNFGYLLEAIDRAKSALRIFEQIDSHEAKRVRQQLKKWQA
jgi:tetratricopeptide (TPR) repeat protein